MKTKSFFVGLTAFVFALVLSSCGNKLAPEKWSVEIEDSFRAQVASSVLYAIADEDVADAFVEKLDDQLLMVALENLFKDHYAKYQLALDEIAEGDDAGEFFLEIYKLSDVKFSKWEQQADEDGHQVWTAIEENSTIPVTFKNNEELDWDLELEEDIWSIYVSGIVDALNED